MPDKDADGQHHPEDAELTGRPSTIRILLVDDHAIVRDSLAKLLGRQEGFEVVGTAEDGQQAVDVALQVEPDVILMDVAMPRMDGIEATRLIKAQLPLVRVIGLSMHADGGVAAAMRQAGACHYLVKAAGPAELVKTIRACYSGSKE